MKAGTLTLNPAIDRTMFFAGEFKAGALNRAVRTVANAGSKGVNVSRALKAMGADAPAYCFCGGDAGESFAKMLADEGIECRFVKTAAETRINIKMTDSLGNCTEANEAGGPITEGELARMLALVEGFADDGANPQKTDSLSTENKQFFFIGGSIPPGVGKDVYKSVVNSLKARGVYTVLDCDGEALRQGMEALPYLIKPNLYELSQYVGNSLSTVDEVVENSRKIYVEKGISVLCTMGGGGSVYAGEQGCYFADTAKVEVRGFTGAGDTFAAAFIFELDRVGDIESALRFAAGASGAKVSMEGTAMPDYGYMRELAEKINVKKIK